MNTTLFVIITLLVMGALGNYLYTHVRFAEKKSYPKIIILVLLILLVIGNFVMHLLTSQP